jgi:hypothetical protein
MGRSRALRRPWSHSTRLFWYWPVLCNVAGTSSSITFAEAGARSVGEDSSNGERGDPRARLDPEPTPSHYQLAVDSAQLFRLATAFDEIRPAI